MKLRYKKCSLTGTGCGPCGSGLAAAATAGHDAPSPLVAPNNGPGAYPTLGIRFNAWTEQ
jgi:hypothetical protein